VDNIGEKDRRHRTSARTFDLSDLLPSQPVRLFLWSGVRPPAEPNAQIRRTLRSSSICLETLSASGSWAVGALNTSGPERGLRVIGYRGAVWGWQWQSRWLITHPFIRDSRHVHHRHTIGRFPPNRNFPRPISAGLPQRNTVPSVLERTSQRPRSSRTS